MQLKKENGFTGNRFKQPPKKSVVVDHCSLRGGVGSAGGGLDAFVAPVCVTEFALVKDIWLLNSGRVGG